MRRNSIRSLEIDGVVVVSHDAKAAAPHSYFGELLCRSSDAAWAFDVDDLFVNCSVVDGGTLIGPFSALEVEAALHSLACSSAAGPNGLGPSFYRATWATVGGSLLRLFKCFHSCVVDFEQINRSHVVLLPKATGCLSPSSFRPVSLQNCNIKMLCKALTMRLQRQIGKLIDVDQTGFLAGRSISENFVYVTELVQTCYRRRAPASSSSSTSPRRLTLSTGESAQGDAGSWLT
jgi:hypothetical protein